MYVCIWIYVHNSAHMCICTLYIYMGSELFLSSFSFRWLPPFLPNLSQDKGHRALPFWALVVTAVALRTAAIVVVVVVEGSGYRVQSSGFRV